MKSTVSLSILIPTYNRENYVGQAIESVLQQPYCDFEIICSDNASTDRTLEILLEYESLDSRIKVFRNSKNLGPVLNWKNCLDHASGDYVHWLWSDDFIEENFYVDAFALLGKSNKSVVTTWTYRLNQEGVKTLGWQCPLISMEGSLAAKKILLHTKELPVSPAAYILPRELAVKHFYLDIPDIGELTPVAKGVGVDSLMVVGSCLDSDKLLVMQKPSVCFRVHENISMVLSRDGTLMRLYLISHLWFLGKMNVQLNISSIFRLFLMCLYFMRVKIFSKKFGGLLLRCSSIWKSCLTFGSVQQKT